MRNSTYTKTKILEQSAILFNTNGYQSTSISDILDQTGFTKGAIYRHFDNKESLEKSALIMLTEKLMSQLQEAIRSASNTPDKLRAVLHYYGDYQHNPPIEGGCPILNASTELDDSRPELCIIVEHAMDLMHASLARVVENGIRHAQIYPSTDSSAFATIFIAAIEGAIMMSRLTKNSIYLDQIINHLNKEIDQITLP